MGKLWSTRVEPPRSSERRLSISLSTPPSHSWGTRSASRLTAGLPDHVPGGLRWAKALIAVSMAVGCCCTHCYGEFRRMASQDRALHRAVQLLEESTSTGDLLELATNPEFSDWVPILETQAEQADSVVSAGS